MPPQPTLTQAAPGPQLLAALPALQRLEEDLAATLTAPMTATERPDGYTQAAWMTAKLLHYLLQATATSDPAERQAGLAEVEADAAAVIGAVHQVRAATASLDELAAAELEQRLLDLDDTVVVDHAALAVTLPTGQFADSGLPVRVGMDGQGRVTVTSSSHPRFGPVDGPTQLGVAAALRTLGHALTVCWQPPEEG
jgi:hypothetical protein